MNYGVRIILRENIIILHAFINFYYIISWYLRTQYQSWATYVYYVSEWFRQDSYSWCNSYTYWFSSIIWRYNSWTRYSIWGLIFWIWPFKKLSESSWWNKGIFSHSMSEGDEVKVYAIASLANSSYFAFWYESPLFCSKYATWLYGYSTLTISRAIFCSQKNYDIVMRQRNALLKKYETEKQNAKIWISGIINLQNVLIHIDNIE